MRGLLFLIGTVVLHLVDNLFSRYLGAGEVTPGVLGDTRHGEVTSDITTGFVALCAIYFPSVTGATYAVRIPVTSSIRYTLTCENKVVW